MNRRDALFRLAALGGGTIFGAGRFLAGVARAAEAPAAWSLPAADLALLNEVAETILPATPDSGGAKAADVALFMQDIVRDFYTDQERAVFQEGLATIRAAAAAQQPGQSFADLPGAGREEILLRFERATPPPEFYQMMKQLTLWGYFTSEVGATQALVHVPIPGMFQGCIPAEPGTRAFSQ